MMPGSELVVGFLVGFVIGFFAYEIVDQAKREWRTQKERREKDG